MEEVRHICSKGRDGGMGHGLGDASGASLWNSCMWKRERASDIL